MGFQGMRGKKDHDDGLNLDDNKYILPYVVPREFVVYNELTGLSRF